MLPAPKAQAAQNLAQVRAAQPDATCLHRSLSLTRKETVRKGFEDKQPLWTRQMLSTAIGEHRLQSEVLPGSCWGPRPMSEILGTFKAVFGNQEKAA